jgi:hypothetical protein
VRGRGNGREAEEGTSEGAIGEEKLLVSQRETVRQEVAQLGLGPSAEDELGRRVEVRAGVAAVGDAGGDDGQDGGRALAPEILPGE